LRPITSQHAKTRQVIWNWSIVRKAGGRSTKSPLQWRRMRIGLAEGQAGQVTNAEKGLVDALGLEPRTR